MFKNIEGGRLRFIFNREKTHAIAKLGDGMNRGIDLDFHQVHVIIYTQSAKP
jgi:hypothetical protein